MHPYGHTPSIGTEGAQRSSLIVSYDQRDWHWDSIASLARARALPGGRARWFRTVLQFGTSVTPGFETQRDATETLSDSRARRHCAVGDEGTHKASTPDTKGLATFYQVLS